MTATDDRAVRLAAAIREQTAGMAPEQRAQVLERLRAHQVRKASLRRLDGPLGLLLALNPSWSASPALQLISDEMEHAITTPGTWLLISMPPQEGKSRLARHALVRALQHNPGCRAAVASYQERLARKIGEAARNIVQTRGSDAGPEHDLLGIAVERGSATKSDWTIRGHEGGVLSVGVGSGITGNAVDLLVVDDPLKGRQQADSETIRDALHDWWDNDAETRLGPGSSVIIIQCMTGDTPVLMADGREKPLRDVRPGDAVATWDDGALTSSTVRNWANQGPDSIYTIRMKSGRVVRANARHPFLTIEDGTQVWRRTDTLRPGNVIQTVTGGSTAESPAPKTDATHPRSARADACPTTTGSAGPTDTDRRRSTPPADAPPTSSTGTASPPTSTTPSWSSRTAGAPCAVSSPPNATPEPTGTGSSAWTTTTTPAASGDCCATTATWPSGTGSPRPCSAPPLTTWKPTPDEVVEVVPSGVEDVYDVQVDRTENFIANGLVSHNTRWHEDDLIGRLTTDPDPDDDLDEVPAEPAHDRTLRVVNIPARADGETLDSLADVPEGRDPDGWLVSVRGDRVPKWSRLAATRPRVWSALYQGRPAPLAGGIFQQQWMDQHRVHAAPDLVRVEIGVDPADTGSSDAAGILVAGRATDGHMYVLADLSGQLSRAQWARRVCLAAVRWEAACIVSERTLGMQTAVRDAWSVLRRQAAALRTANGLVEDAQAALLAAGDDVAADEPELRELVPFVDRVLTRPSSGPCRVDVVTPKQAKATRAEAITVYYEVGRVHHVGKLAQLEHEQTTWQEGQDSPNRLDTLAHLLPHLDGQSADGRVSKGTRRVSTRTHGGGVNAPKGPTRRTGGANR